MRLAPVELNDQPLFAPEAVGLEFEPAEVEESVHPGPWKVGSCEQGREPDLQPAPCATSWAKAQAMEAGSDRGRTSPSRVPLQDALQLLELKTVAVFCLADSGFQPLVW